MASNLFDVVIAGAGPSGTRTAELLSKEGLKVLILEKKASVGKTACSGLISTRLNGIIPVENELILNLIRGVRIHYGKSSILLEKDRIAAFVIDRVKLDNYLLSRAKKAGAEIHLGEAFEKYAIKGNAVVVNDKYRAKILVGADGATSRVRQLSGLVGNLTLMNGAIAYFREKSSESHVDIYYDNKFSPDFFAWKIPRGDSVEYGVASKKNHLEFLRKFLKTENQKLESFYAHPIVSGIQETAGERLILVGDAAAQVKPFSGGGVIYGLLCAKIAANAIISASKKNDFSEAFLKSHYDKRWKAQLLAGMEKGAMLLKSIKSLSEREKTLLFDMLREKKGEAEEFADMDFLQ